MNPIMRKLVVSSTALALLLGSGTAALAKNGKGNDDDHKFGRSKQQYEAFLKQVQAQAKAQAQAQVRAKGSNGLEIKLTFNDMKSGDAMWALRYIASLASKQIFEGYEDGTFKPYNNVSRIEAIAAAVRLMGLREQAESPAEMQTKLNFKDANEIPAWAVGYVAVAVENNLFAESEAVVQANKPADRLWATTLLVKALKLDAEAQAKMNTQLTFKDADKIPAGSVGYVALAVERGLIDGFEDNTFRPNVPVTRAQIAALLDRTGSQLPGANDDAATGTVSAAVYNNLLTLTNNGETLSYALNANTFVFRGGQQVAASELQVGDQVRVRTVNGIVVYVEVVQRSEVSPSFTVDGTLSYYNINNDGDISQIVIVQDVNGTVTTSVYNVSADATISGDASKLVAGQAVQLQGKDNLVSTIVVK
ncbi:S-layer homology domain-containing protein [Paenibacillus chartarius]|uniref:S-layer homology domain-containing protein n=1 Tax=Paenibacillus chartarius TaxID=747481 RepID=A0ABV6DJA0_9BACL